MKNLYIIYGCNKYWDRLRCSRETWMKHIGPDEDYIILGETRIPELKMTGFNSDDGSYLNIGMRTLMFLDEYSDFLRQWDWITFVDDDAYIFRKRLRKEFNKVDDKNKSIIMGKTPGERQMIVGGSPVSFTLMHGGATISLNRRAVQTMLLYLDKNRESLYNRDRNDSAFYSFGDVCVSCLCRKSRATIINSPYKFSFLNFKKERLKNKDFYRIITSHYLTNEDKKKLYELDFDGRN